MGFFDFFSSPSPSKSGNKKVSAGSGKKLKSNSSMDTNLSTLESILQTYRTPKYKDLPHYFHPGWSWVNQEEVPERVVIFDDKNNEIVFAAFWNDNTGSNIGLFPLGTGDDRLSELTIIEHWKSRDASLNEIGIIPGKQLLISAPVIKDDYIQEILEKTGNPSTQKNVDILGRELRLMFLIKSSEYIMAVDNSYVNIFSDNHRYKGEPFVDFYRNILEDLIIWNPQVTPYIQTIPTRFRAMLLNENITGEHQNFWSKLEK